MSVTALLALSLLSQRADAGVVARRAPADAGVTLEAPRPATPAVDTKRLERELAEVKQRLADAEARLVKAEAAAEKVEALGKRLEALDTAVEKLETAEARRAEAEDRAVRRRAQLEQATTALGGALQTLSTGGTAVEGALRAAENSYTGAALQYLKLARQALANGDLNNARQAILAAMLEAQAER